MSTMPTLEADRLALDIEEEPMVLPDDHPATAAEDRDDTDSDASGGDTGDGVLPPFSNVSHSGIQNLSSNISHSRLRVNPTILIVHCFWVFPNRKMCMQHVGGGTCWGCAWEKAC